MERMYVPIKPRFHTIKWQIKTAEELHIIIYRKLVTLHFH